jgi:hypothetical protein
MFNLLLRYFANATSFQPVHVQLVTGLTSDYNLSVFYAVRFTGLLSVESSQRYTFSYSYPQLQQSSTSTVLLYIDGVDLSNRQADGGTSVLPPSFFV